ncbi:hypothetical protein EAH_00068100, partial [Eimeria acervulina]
PLQLPVDAGRQRLFLLCRQDAWRRKRLDVHLPLMGGVSHHVLSQWLGNTMPLECRTRQEPWMWFSRYRGWRVLALPNDLHKLEEFAKFWHHAKRGWLDAGAQHSQLLLVLVGEGPEISVEMSGGGFLAADKFPIGIRSICAHR